MPSFALPPHLRILDPDPDGPIRRAVQFRLPVVVECGPGILQPLDFVFDSGSAYTLMSATLARSFGIAFPAERSRVGMTTAAGATAAEVHDGELRVRFPPLPGRVFRLYCVFSEAVPPAVPPVFGVNDFLDLFRVTLDGFHRPDAPFGRMTVETADGPP